MRSIIKEMLRENNEEKVKQYLMKNYDGKVEEVEGFKFKYYVGHLSGNHYIFDIYSIDIDGNRADLVLKNIGFRYFLLPKEYSHSNIWVEALAQMNGENLPEDVIYRELYEKVAIKKFNTYLRQRLVDIKEYLNIQFTFSYYGIEKPGHLRESMDNKEKIKKYLQKKFEITEIDGFRFKGEVSDYNATPLVKFCLLKDKTLVDQLYINKVQQFKGYDGSHTYRLCKDKKIFASFSRLDKPYDEEELFNALLKQAARRIFELEIEPEFRKLSEHLGTKVLCGFVGIITSSSDLMEQTDPDKRIRLFRLAEVCRERYKGKVVRSTMGTYCNYKIVGVSLDKNYNGFFLRFDMQPLKGGEYQKNAHDYMVKDLRAEVEDYYSIPIKITLKDRAQERDNLHW